MPNAIINRHGKSPYVTKPNFKNECFIIHHSCSSVEYNSIGFAIKNKDEFPSQMVELVETIP